MHFLEVHEVSKRLNEVAVVNNVSFIQRKGQKLAIAGETGSGKSTLLKIIAGIVQPDDGALFFNGQRILGPEEQLLPGRPEITYLSQHFELRNNYRVEELLDYANKWSQHDADVIYEVCQIEHLLKRRTDQLSGGEKQRIATARLLISSPQLLLLDEPYTNLDIAHRNILKNVISDIVHRLQITCILISHDPVDVLSWADKIIVMQDGRIVQQDTPKAIYHHPKDTYVAGLFGSFNILSAEIANQFSALQNQPLSTLPQFVRPEYLQLTDEANGIAGRIISQVFAGSYYELQVRIGDQTLTMATTDASSYPGEVAFVRLKQIHVE